MITDRIPLIRPDVRFDDVADDIREILDSGILTSGRHVAAFEEEVAAYVGVDHAVAVTSATTALHLALVCVGVQPGDDVLVSNFTFPATANVVFEAGARPVLVDSRADGFEIDVDDLDRRRTNRTSAIIAVDPFGQPADHRRLEDYAAAHGLRLIADAACSLGSARHGRRCGAHGDVGCFSFHPRKTITCGEGGMLTTDDAELAERARRLRSHGARRTDDGIVFDEPGFNYRLSEVQAAIGRSQLRRLDEILGDRAHTVDRYVARLADVPGVLVPRRPSDAEWSHQSFVVVLADPIDRPGVIARMAESGIETTIGTYACHQHPAFQAGRTGDPLPNSARWADQSLTLPVVPAMSDETIDRVVSALADAVRESHR